MHTSRQSFRAVFLGCLLTDGCVVKANWTLYQKGQHPSVSTHRLPLVGPSLWDGGHKTTADSLLQGWRRVLDHAFSKTNTMEYLYLKKEKYPKAWLNSNILCHYLLIPLNRGRSDVYQRYCKWAHRSRTCRKHLWVDVFLHRLPDFSHCLHHL